MSRRLLFFALAAPLMIGGSLAGRAVSYCLAVPNSAARARLLDCTGHRYLDLMPIVIGVLAAVALIGFVLELVEAVSGRPSRRVAAAVFFVLPALGFAIQELVQCFLHSGGLVGSALGPSFLVGLALQIPFGLLAIAVHRALAHAAQCIGTALRAQPVPASGPASSPRRWPTGVRSIRPRAIALRLAERGPPGTLATAG